MTAKTERRVEMLERGQCANSAARPLPMVLPDTATDDELDTLQRRGIQAYRFSDPAILDLFV